ncbi:lactate utilization protein [Desulforhopalus vacuolatus]|uniref:LutC/YkgG family protein n=1 Tax=Desulforhopalus vacuolatus TaxID=40414 RepID=UPI001963EA80|nr:lactate utilization protein [Desulforhopalus vacuolatus]MBM9518938.1 lactate utilization protein [Desulforhopalus vacuolatus]
MTTQKDFIGDISTALGRPTPAAVDLFTVAPTTAEQDILKNIRQRSPGERQPFIKTLQEVSVPLHLDFHPERSLEDIRQAIITLILEKDPEWGTKKSVVRWDHPLLNSLNLEAAAELKDISLYTTSPVAATLSAEERQQQRQQTRKEVEESFIGITSADYCIAATATLAMKTRPGQARSVSLVPSIHLAVVEESKLLATLEELYTLLKWDEAEQAEGLTNNLSLVSGPSKTGDIELVMVHGAHGPRELHLFLVADRS